MNIIIVDSDIVRQADLISDCMSISQACTNASCRANQKYIKERKLQRNSNVSLCRKSGVVGSKLVEHFNQSILRLPTKCPI
uniref:AlNc14C5G739 protein n=1 Tax=Albugo laibachii Nc14 TaxID=890382 RepID=F0W0V9_9STRA|nr:AlNc14C5G739 [Albugo laibachii Nc14]|eukprot:CCA14683.1 AlNc14C5G739 [Albugo laibachii Nc14]